MVTTEETALRQTALQMALTVGAYADAASLCRQAEVILKFLKGVDIAKKS